MAAGGGGGTTTTTTGQLIVRAQKSTNQLKALLAKLLPGAAAEGAAAVEAILSDMSESLSEALESLQAGASDGRRLPARPEASMSGCGQSVVSRGGRSVSRRSGQRRSRVDGSSRRIVLQLGDPGDAYPWRKYGQKDILGARFARNYYRCAQRSGCSARKHVQQSDDDPTQVEITYIGAHTCDERPPSPAISHVDDTQGSGVSHRRLPAAAAVPPALQKLEEHLPASDMMACTPSMEEEMASSWLFIPSPACSQSELLSEAAEVPEVRPDASPARPVEHKKACDDETFLALYYDAVVPDLM